MKRNILMLEHDEDDRYITQAVLDELKADITISFVSNSTDFLRQVERLQQPDLLLITYRATPLPAPEILRRLRSGASTRHIPAVVLSGVSNPTIIRECYEAGASSFIVKPSSDKGTTEKISAFLKYWFDTVELS